MRPTWMAKSVARKARIQPRSTGRRRRSSSRRRSPVARTSGSSGSPRASLNVSYVSPSVCTGAVTMFQPAPRMRAARGERHDPGRGGAVPQHEEDGGRGQVAGGGQRGAADRLAPSPSHPDRAQLPKSVDQEEHTQQEHEAGADQGGRRQHQESHGEGEAAAPRRRAPGFRADPPHAVQDLEHPREGEEGADQLERSLTGPERRHGGETGQHERDGPEPEALASRGLGGRRLHSSRDPTKIIWRPGRSLSCSLTRLPRPLVPARRLAAHPNHTITRRST